MRNFYINCLILLGMTITSYDKINIFATPQVDTNFQIQAIDSEIEINEDESFINANHRIEIFYDETYENSTTLKELHEFLTTVMDKNNVSFRFHNINHIERLSYLSKLLTFFNLDSQNLNQSYMIINNQLLVQEILTYSPSEFEQLIEGLLSNNISTEKFVTLKTNMIPNIYFNNIDNKVAPLFQNVPFITELPTLSMLPIKNYGIVDDLRWELAPRRVEVFLDDTDEYTNQFVEETLNPMIVALTESDAVIRFYNVNHDDIIAYLTEILDFYGLKLSESDIYPLTVVNNRFLITTPDKLNKTEYRELIYRLLNEDVIFNEDIYVYEVLEEYKLTASRMYYSDGLAKKTHVASPAIQDIQQDEAQNLINFEEVEVEVFNDDLEEKTVSVGKQKLITATLLIVFTSIPILSYCMYKYQKLK